MWRIEVSPRAGRWVVCIHEEDGGSIQHSYPTKKQALYFAAVYQLQSACMRSGENKGEGES